MQFLFSISRDGDLKFEEASKRYWKSIEVTYELFLYNIFVLIEVVRCAQEDVKNRKTKHLPTAFDKKFSDKIFSNSLIQSLAENDKLLKEFKKTDYLGISNTDYFGKIYNSFAKSDEYLKYVENDSTDKEHIEILLELYRYCRKDELFNELMEDAYPQWIDDKSVVIGSVKKALKELPSDNETFFEKYYPDEETVKAYGYELFSKTHSEDEKLLEIIKPILKNWDHDRVAIIDMILLKMALVEFLHFETIPTTVTLNEYLEVSKMYSTAKSKDFINGILDRIKNDLLEKKMINKSVKESK